MLGMGCPKCWESDCICGYQYFDWSIEQLEHQIKMLQEVLNAKKEKKSEKKRLP